MALGANQHCTMLGESLPFSYFYLWGANWEDFAVFNTNYF